MARILHGTTCLLALALAVHPVPLLSQSPASQGPSRTLTDLACLLDSGVVLLDRNDDGVVDDLDMSLLLPSGPSESEVAAAANLAARLGYETSGSDLDLADFIVAGRRYASPVILIGRRAVEAAGVASEEGGAWESLSPGQGAVVYLEPTPSFAAGAVAVVGYDASGLMAAAAYVSGRYPGIWAPDGPTWGEVAEKVETFAGGHDAAGAEAVLDRIVLDESRTGVPRARVVLEVPARDAFDAVVEALTLRDTASTADSTLHQAADSAASERAADSAASEAADSAGAPMAVGELEFRGLHRLDVLVQGDGESRLVTLRPAKPWDLREDAALRPGADPSFALPSIYQAGGLFRDTNRDLVPDEMAGYVSLSGAAAPDAVVDLATRIGLETAGIRLPLLALDGQEDDPAAKGFPLLMGVDHYQISRLREEGRLPGTNVGAGEGFAQFVNGAFGDRNALAVGGGDEAGFEAVTRWLATRAPYLWTYGKGEYRLADAETEVRRFLQASTAPGQLALALTKLGSWMDRMSADPPSRVEVELAALDVPEEVEEVVRGLVRERFSEADVSIRTWSTGFGVGDTVFAEEWDLPWEVDEARRVLEEEVYPRVRSGSPTTVEVRVSEPPEVRSALEAEIRERLAALGSPAPAVRVLSAYKQGYSWINDVLLPRLRELPVASVDLTYHTLEESEEVRWQTIAAKTRWLQEVYPIDAVLARELRIPDSAVVFHPTRQKDPIYTFEARDSLGSVVLRETFDPHYVVRPFFDLFPEYEQVRVTTGWLTATSGRDTLVDQRIVTDPERFWDRLQTDAYSKIISYVMDLEEGAPSGDDAPYFDEFRVDLRLSEPDYRIGIDEETISSLEALHEDIFFETHTLFSLIGGRYQTSLSYPGRVLPFVDPSGAGRPGRARISLTGKTRGSPKLLVRTWSDGRPEPTLQEYALQPLPVEDPGLVGVTVAAGEDGLRQVMVRATLPDSVDRFEEFRGRSSEGTIDRQFMNVELLDGMVASLERLHNAGIMEDVLSWDRVGELALDLRVEEDSTYRHLTGLPRSRHPGSTDNPKLDASGWTYQGRPLVQWDNPISVEENAQVLSRLGTFPGVNAYYLTDSYLGHRVWAADFLPPYETRYVSQAKLNALKPTLFVSGREHANEVSSTSHVLRLGELLVTDSAYKAMLKKVNVVLHPMTNPDGAALAYERQLVNPDHMLHAGRPGALGVDATSGGGSADPMYPEAKARTMLREAWLPDIYLNPHGYPSHEWVQYFAGYSAWVRGRRVGPRDWWVPRGWFIPGFSWVDDQENPEYNTAQFAILDSIAAAMTGNPEVDALNRRLYARYKKYGQQDREGFTEYFHNGIVVSQSLRGSESIGNGVNSPRITYFSITTEAPDETARGPYLHLMGQAGLAHTTAALRYLASGHFEVERDAEAFADAVVRKVFRVKPVLPARQPEE